jgi:hypothetical protein
MNTRVSALRIESAKKPHHRFDSASQFDQSFKCWTRPRVQKLPSAAAAGDRRNGSKQRADAIEFARRPFRNSKHSTCSTPRASLATRIIRKPTAATRPQT